jgi:O-acetyl-ADP-ribose deacetylase (regulator of RNase III)
MKEIKGDLIKLAIEGNFDVITHGCNCFCTMGAGIAPQMAKAFGADKFRLESPEFRGEINKLGCIDYKSIYRPTKKEIPIGNTKELFMDFGSKDLIVVNSYTQYRYGRNHYDGDKTPVDYDAITMCMRKINHKFPGKEIGLPLIGAGLAGGDWGRIKEIILKELKDLSIIIVHYNK